MSDSVSIEQINRFHKESLISTLGIVCTCVKNGYIEMTMPVTEVSCQPIKVLHGGASLALAETAAGCGSYYMVNGEKFPWGIHVNGTHISPAPLGETVIAKASLFHKTNTVHIWDVNIYILNSGQLISSSRVTNRLKEFKPTS